MSLIRRAVSTALEARAADQTLPWGNSVPPSNGMLGGSSAGQAVTQQSALQIAAVFGCVNLLSSSVAGSPIRLMDSPVLKNAKELPASALITQPYAEISLMDWVVQFVASLALRGNFFGQILGLGPDGKAGPVTQIKPIPADNATVRRNPTTGALEYRFFNQPVPTRQVFHVKMLSMPGMLVGVNPIENLRLSFGLSLAQERYGESFFRNSAYPAGVIEVEGDLDVTETKAMQQSWIAAHQGTNQANLPAVLTDGATFKPVTITPEDSQFLESRNFSAGEISGMIFRIPPHMIGLVDRTTSWGTGIEQQQRGYTLDTLGDYITRLQGALTALHPPGQFVNVDLSHRERGDTLQRAQASSLAMLGGFWTANESRALFDMPARPDGDQLFGPINMELLTQLQAEAKAAIVAAKNPQPEPPPQQFGGPGGPPQQQPQNGSTPPAQPVK